MRERHAPLTEEELDAVTVVFHQFETGLREGTIYTKVSITITYILRGKASLKIRRQNAVILCCIQDKISTVECIRKIKQNQYPLLTKRLSSTE